MRVLVVVPTLGKRRLEPLLRAIATECTAIVNAGHVAKALVLHNGPASPVLAGGSHDVGLSYGNHEALGYSQIRNEAIRRAIADDFDVLVMIDDDEIPCRGWLTALIAPFGLDADVVVGPVTTTWPPGAPSRFVRSALPRPVSNLPDGWIDSDLRAGNCAIRLGALGSIRFDDRFNAAGGEDTAFFRELRAAGARCFWAGSASVAELVDDDRVRLAYFARRSFTQGRAFAAIRALVPREDDPSLSALIRTRAARVVRLVSWTIRRRRLGHLLEGICEIAFVAGYVIGQRPATREAANRRPSVAG